MSPALKAIRQGQREGRKMRMFAKVLAQELYALRVPIHIVPKDQPNIVTVIDSAVCQHFDIQPSDLRRKTRQQYIAWPRQVCIYFLSRAGWKLQRIGKAYGVHQTTCYHALKAVAGRMESNPHDKAMIDKLAPIVEGMGRLTQ